MSSVHTVPVLFLNLGGEMLYILDQRLTAQKIAKDKAIKVMNDIVGIMFNERFLVELFKPQEVYNKHALRKLFEDLAHASIMRLNKASMDKLYDLMTMTFKYQLFMASQPLDIIYITLNHIDTIRSFVPSPHIQKQIDVAYQMLIDDLKVRVSVFLKQGVQKDDGKFIISACGPVPAGFEVPGHIRIYGWDGHLIQERQFEAGGYYAPATSAGSLEKHGDRGTKLGCNIYKEYPASGKCSPDQETQAMPSGLVEAGEAAIAEAAAVGRDELNLLMAQLLGRRGSASHSSHGCTHFQLHLFSQEADDEDLNQLLKTKEAVSIDASSHPRSAVLDQIYGELTIEETQTQDIPQDIVDMLDNLL